MSEPNINFDLETMNVMEGDAAIIECTVFGKPKPNVLWKGPDGHIAIPTERIDWLDLPEDKYGFMVSSSTIFCNIM